MTAMPRAAESAAFAIATFWPSIRIDPESGW